MLAKNRRDVIHLKAWRRNHNKISSRHDIVKTHFPGWSTDGRIVTIAQVLLRIKGYKPHSRLPSLVALYQEDKPPECLALKTSRAYFQKSQRTVGNKNSTLKGHTQNLTHSETQKRSCKLKESWIRHTFWSWRASQRNRGNWSSPWGHRHGQQSLGETYSTKRTLELPSTILESPL